MPQKRIHQSGSCQYHRLKPAALRQSKLARKRIIRSSRDCGRRLEGCFDVLLCEGARRFADGAGLSSPVCCCADSSSIEQNLSLHFQNVTEPRTLMFRGSLALSIKRSHGGDFRGSFIFVFVIQSTDFFLSVAFLSIMTTDQAIIHWCVVIYHGFFLSVAFRKFSF